MKHAREALEMGAAYPYDAGAEFLESKDGRAPPPAKDWAHGAARGVLADLSDRRGIKWALEDETIDYEARAEIVNSLAEIIRLAAELGRRM